MRWTIQEKKQLKKLYTKTNLPLEEIAVIIGRSAPALNNQLGELRVKRRKPLKFRYPPKISPALARIHAHLCGDGCIYYYREKDCYGPWAKYRKNPYRTRYMIAYTNKNKDLLNEFRQDIFSTFNIRGKKTYFKPPKIEIKVTSKKAYELMRDLGAGNSFKWRVPKVIEHSSKKIMKNWLRAFFDDEAHFNDDGRIRVKCVNKKGLIQIMNMLRNFVPCHLTPKNGFYWGRTVCINIAKRDAPKFFSDIGSIRYKAPV